MSDQKEPIKRQTSPVQRIRHGLENPDAQATLAYKPSTVTVAQRTNNRQITMEGFRNLGVVAIFLAVIQAQMLSISLSDKTTASQFSNAFWFAGIILDVFGAVMAILAARWFAELDAKCIEIFDSDRTHSVDSTTLSQRKFPGFIDKVIAHSLFSGFLIVEYGVVFFLIGLTIYILEKQSLFIIIIATIPLVFLVPLVAVVHVPHTTRRENIIQILKGKMGNE